MPGDMFPSDEELGRRDDDHRASSRRWNGAKHSSVSGLSRRLLTKRRYVIIGLMSLILWILYYFQPPNLMEPSIPSRLQPPVIPDHRYPRPPGPLPQNGQIRAPWSSPLSGSEKTDSSTENPAVPSRKGSVTNVEPTHDYSGPLKFYALPRSLQRMYGRFGHHYSRRNVLFAASSLKSLSALLPVACELGNRQRAAAFVAIVGRNDLSITSIMEINGINETSCNVQWLDGRPDFSPFSTDTRAELGVMAALTQICAILRPRVIIKHHSQVEDAFFNHAVEKKSAEYSTPLIELPEGRSERLLWIAMMDATALSAWHATTIDILIQASKGTTGSLMRLLTSLYTADYAGSAPPRVTVELNQDVDDITRTYIRNLPWPPPSSSIGPTQSAGRSGGLLLRHRISTDRLTPEDASIRFMESFYPADSENNHVLVLAANMQVSPLYFQYLKYNILEYHCSEMGRSISNLMGFSLELSGTHMNGSSGFERPKDYLLMPWERSSDTNQEPSDPPPFQWQMPNANAALYFGAKWVELHAFLAERLRIFHRASTKAAAQSVPPQPKLLTSSSPAWLEYALELTRCRGYSMLYPSTKRDKRAPSSKRSASEWVTMHDEQYNPPEEFMMHASAETGRESDTADPLPDSTFEEPFIPPTANSSSSRQPSPLSKRPENLIPSTFMPLHQVLPIYHPPRSSLSSEPDNDDQKIWRNELPPLTSLPLMSWDSRLITSVEALENAALYAEDFRREQGACSKEASELLKDRIAAGRVIRQEGDVKDLFCVS